MRLTFALALIAACSSPKSEPLRVAAASDLGQAFEALASRFEQQGGAKVSFTFGASGQLQRQLEAGAPFDVFASANVEFAQAAVSSGACDGATLRRFARGQLALLGAGSLDELGDERFRRIALANPETAPYGRAAREALTAAGLWGRLQGRLVFAENVRQAVQLHQTGNVEAALVAHALVLDGGVSVDEALHQPLVQAVVRCRAGRNSAAAEAFVRLLTSGEGVALLARYGFEPPT